MICHYHEQTRENAKMTLKAYESIQSVQTSVITLINKDDTGLDQSCYGRLMEKVRDASKKQH